MLPWKHANMLPALLVTSVFLNVAQGFWLESSDLSGPTSWREERSLGHCGPNDTAPPNRVNTTRQVALLREQMARLSLAVLVLPIDEEGRLRWTSGFSGSNGQAVLTMVEALLWTDGRYFIQAAQQLDCQWTLMKMGEDGVPTLPEWVAALGEGEAGADPQLVGAGDWLEWSATMAEGGVQLKEVANLVDLVWTEAEGRPPAVHKEVVIQPLRFAGEAWQDKVARLRKELVEQGLYGMVVTELDEVAWLLNVRGTGASHLSGLLRSPVFKGLALLTTDQLQLWVHTDKVAPPVVEHLAPPGCEAQHLCVQLRDIDKALAELEVEVSGLESGRRLLVTRPSAYLSGANYAVYSSVAEEHRSLGDSPILLMKAVKNPVEEAGMVEAHVRDAMALVGWAAVMEQQVEREGARNWTEISAAELLAGYRARQEDNKGLSFGTISAFGSNGAIIHYSPTPETDAAITSEGLFMVDSGGQYLDGTTDVTRTFHYGTPTEEMVDRYTEVLQGAIELARVIVPDGTLDSAVDLATRQYLYRQGLDYRHGTGHGIGAYLKVHEGPTLVRMANKQPSKLRAGMFFSDEPGFYKEGEFGLRLETILRVVKANTTTEFGDFIEFLPVTLVPFEPKLIRYSLLSPAQIDWLNDYNKICLDEVGLRLLEAGDTLGAAWLEARTGWIEPGLAHSG